MKTRLFVVVAVLSGLFAVVAGPALAQSTGNIAGSVKDGTGAVLPGVTIEAASPALIEKVRVVVSDAQGSYRITDLRPGTYSVTFTLPGFSTFKREGLVLSTGVTVPANAEMQVGGLEETVTVSGASPTVDVQNVRTQKVLTEEVLNALPNGKMTNAFIALTVGAVQQGQTGMDVGGSRGEASTQISIHGSRGDDLQRMIDGMNFNMLTGGGGHHVTFRVSSVGMQETVLESNATAETQTTGGINYVPKDGGNTLTGLGVLAFTNQDLQSENLTDLLRQRGATTITRVKKIFDYGLGIGGPIKKDKLWFYSANRYWGAQTANPGAFWNLNKTNVGDPNSGVRLYTPDTSRPGFEDQWNKEFSGRFTWQAAEKHKLTYTHFLNMNCNCLEQVSNVLAPEATSSPLNGWNNFIQTTWTYPATNRLLFTAGATWGLFPISHDFVANPPDDVPAGSIFIQDIGTGIQYNSRQPSHGVTSYGKGRSNNLNQRVTAAYVTGTHSFKAGGFFKEGHYYMESFIGAPVGEPASLSYIFRNGQPVSLNQWVTRVRPDLKLFDMGLYAQDQWTLRKLTLNLGIRYDQFDGKSLETPVEAGRFTPAVVFPEVTGIPQFKDISPRLGASYDLFGDGRTAIKASLGRYVIAMATNYIQPSAPVFQLVQQTNRAWTDANGNYVPDCDLQNRTANGECGGIADTAFGSTRRTTTWSDEVLRGFGNRTYSWQGALSLQHELASNVGLTVGYYRTSFSNLTVTDNQTVTPADYDPYCAATPVDARLPGGGGQQVCGLFNLNPSKFGLPAQNVVRLDKHFEGDNVERFNGVDISVNARFGRGGLLNAGTSLGRLEVFNCKIVDSPEAARPNFCTPGTAFGVPAGGTPPWWAGTQFKVNGMYPLPGGFEVSGVFQNLPGAQQQATVVASNAQVAPSLGRNLAGCPAVGACSLTVAFQAVQPFTQFERRLTQVDLRLTKVFQFGGTRIKGMFDVYNMLNASTIIAANGVYGGTWLRPTFIHPGRLFKFGGEVTF